MLVKNMKYRILSYIQTGAYNHNLDSESSLGQFDDGVVRSVVTQVNFEDEVTVSSLSNVVDASTGKTLQETCDSWTHTFVGSSKVDIKKSQLLTSTFKRRRQLCKQMLWLASGK